MAKKFVDVTIGIYEEKHSVASCYQEEIVPMKFQTTMESIEEDIKKNLSKKLFFTKANKGKLPDNLGVTVTVDKTTLIDETWCILDKFHGKCSVKDTIEMDSTFIEEISKRFAVTIADKIYHFIPRTFTFRHS